MFTSLKGLGSKDIPVYLRVKISVILILRSLTKYCMTCQHNTHGSHIKKENYYKDGSETGTMFAKET